ncbi:MAG: hypothetical protein Q9169_006073 [Polycauliona sp. 2 TL-2023]
MQTTAGSWALLGSKVPKDAHIVSCLRDAGAVIIGHANMSEWAAVRSSQYSTGYSPRGGQCIKPTVGLTSRTGVIPISKNMDSVGVFGRTVSDAIRGLDLIAGRDDEDPMTHVHSSDSSLYSDSLACRIALKGAKFGLPWSRCWDCVAPQRKEVALQIFKAMEDAGAEITRTDFPCAEDRIAPDGSWDWKRGKASESEYTVVKTDAYNGINACLSQLSETPVKSVEDVLAFNTENTGTEGALPGDVPAFPSGQDDLEEVVGSQGLEDETYSKALQYTQYQCRTQGIDAALHSSEDKTCPIEYDALLLCDHKGAGQQLAAQAGYPIITIPIGIDADGFPVSLSFQHRAWQERTLIKWASAVEDLVHEIQGWRPTPEYRNYHSKNIPVDPID